jgi:FkbM family methyltransferase
MAEVSDSICPKPPRRRWLRQLRTLGGYLRTIDFEEIFAKIGKLEASLASTEASQRRMTNLLLSEHCLVPVSRLIALGELSTVDRFELEGRCRAMTNAAYLGNDTALCRILGSYKLYLDTRDTGFGSHVMLDGYWEMWLTIFFARHLRTGMTVIDVGANFGYYTLLFGALVGSAGRVYAFEPNPEAIGKLRRSVDLNGFSSRTTVVAAAAGAANGTEATLFAPHGEPKNGAIISASDVIPAHLGTVYTVPQVTIDHVVGTAPRVDFVKIDAEGAEQAVIAGMMQILKRDRPNLILEFNAVRYANPRRFVEELQRIYDEIYYVNFDGNAISAPLERIINDTSRDDWLLYLTCETEKIDQAGAG